jgi:[protein-PII] uridylyltransferase
VSLRDGGKRARARAAELDSVLIELASDAIDGAALIAVGGYGRGELSPHSDVDLLLLVRKGSAVSFRELLYPLWDTGFSIGHAVRTPRDTVERAAHDLHAATSILSARLVFGDERLFEELLDRRGRYVDKNGRVLARRILQELADRHRRADRAGWALAPDIKDDIGGLRDLHTLGWLISVSRDDEIAEDLRSAGETLLAVREALHGEIRRSSDRLLIDLQPAIARRLGLSGEDAADELMAVVHSEARTIEYSGALARNDLRERLLGGPRRSGEARALTKEIHVTDGTLRVRAEATIPVILQLLTLHASSDHPLDPGALASARDAFDRDPLERWDIATWEAFSALLHAPRASAALELLDHLGGWHCLLPEWDRVRGRAQYDLYHRYTVDGHSFLAVEEVTRVLKTDPLAASAAAEAGDLGPLYVGALLHDVGKGSGEDHSVAGERIARSACARIGLPEAVTDDVCALVRWHLLLADTATRRDLDDGAVIESVAKTLKDARRLRLLYVLTIADGRATGPEGWTDWKAALTSELFRKVLIALDTGRVPVRSDVSAKAAEVEAYEPTLAGRAEQVLSTLPPSYLASATVPDVVDEVRLLLQAPKAGEVRYVIEPAPEGDRTAVTVVIPDRPGALARTAGALALNRISVLHAQAFSTTTGLALQRFVVHAESHAVLQSFASDLESLYGGRLALEARLERKVRDYKPSGPVAADVRVLQDASDHSTVVEVRCQDVLGLLYAVTAGLSDLDLDIHVAKIDTLGERVVDVFYVRTPWGAKLAPEQADEVGRAIGHRLDRMFGS